MLEGLREIRAWQVGVLVAVVMAGIGVAVGVFLLVDRAGDTSLAEGQQLIPITVGDLVNDISINGSLVFPDRDTLSLGVQGTVAEILVEEGDRVEEGQPLARLDSETAVGLEKAVAQAEIALRNAEEALAKALDPHTPLEIAQAESAVANARLALSDAQEALSVVLEPTAQDMAQAETKVANARLAHSDAQEALSALLEPTAQELAREEANVIDARLAVESASSTLAALLNGPTTDAIAESQSRIDSASVTLTNAQRDFDLTQNDWDDKLQAARDAVDQAIDDYRAAFDKWLGIEPTDEETGDDPEMLLASWAVDLGSLFDPPAQFGAPPSRFGGGLPSDDPATAWDESVVYVWVNFSPGVIAPTCDDGVVRKEGWCVKKEMDDGWDALQQPRDDLETQEIQAAKAVDTAQAAVTRADESLVNARDALAELEEPADALEVESAEKQLEVAVLALAEAESDLAALTGGPDPLDLEVRRKQVLVAGANLDEAENALDALTSGPDPLELEERQTQALVAQATLADAEENLSELKSSVDPLEVTLRQAEVASSREALETALQRLEGAVIKAPWTGVVSDIRVQAGQSVNAGVPILEIVDPSVVEVAGVVDEIDVLFIREGAQAAVTMDALPGQVLAGVVSDIAPSAESQQGVVSYPVSIRLELPDGLELPEGLSAVAQVVLREDRNVLLVPLDALSGTFDRPIVRVMTDEGIVERPVALGNSDEFWVVVTDGLAAGDTVVVETSQATTQGFGFGRGFTGGFGGGFGRGFTGGGPGGGQGGPRPSGR